MSWVKRAYSLLTLLTLIIVKWRVFKNMLDRRLVSITEDLYDDVISMASDYEDRNFEIVELLDERLASRGLDFPEETVQELAKYYIERTI